MIIIPFLERILFYYQVITNLLILQWKEFPRINILNSQRRMILQYAVN